MREQEDDVGFADDFLPELPPAPLGARAQAAVEDAVLRGPIHHGATVNLFNSVLAGGISFIPLPYCAKLTGLTGFALLLLIAALASALSALTLVRVSALTGAMTYDGAAETSIGRPGAAAVNIIIVASNFGICVALLDVFCDIVPNLVDFDRTVAVGVVCVVLLPVCISVRRIEALSWASAFATACATLFLVMVVGKGGQTIGTAGAPPMCGSNCHESAPKVLLAVSEIAMSWVCHFNVLPIFEVLLVRASDVAYDQRGIGGRGNGSDGDGRGPGAVAEAAAAMRTSSRAMRRIVGKSLAAAFVVYAAVGMLGCDYARASLCLAHFPIAHPLAHSLAYSLICVHPAIHAATGMRRTARAQARTHLPTTIRIHSGVPAASSLWRHCLRRSR